MADGRNGLEFGSRGQHLGLGTAYAELEMGLLSKQSLESKVALGLMVSIQKWKGSMLALKQLIRFLAGFDQVAKSCPFCFH